MSSCVRRRGGRDESAHRADVGRELPDLVFGNLVRGTRASRSGRPSRSWRGCSRAAAVDPLVVHQRRPHAAAAVGVAAAAVEPVEYSRLPSLRWPRRCRRSCVPRARPAGCRPPGCSALTRDAPRCRRSRRASAEIALLALARRRAGPGQTRTPQATARVLIDSASPAGRPAAPRTRREWLDRRAASLHERSVESRLATRRRRAARPSRCRRRTAERQVDVRRHRHDPSGTRCARRSSRRAVPRRRRRPRRPRATASTMRAGGLAAV